MTFNEQELVIGCQQRNRVAQKQLYDVFGGKLFAICLRYTKNRNDAEDVLQDAFIKIYENISTFRNDSPLEYWLRSIAVNTALNHLRQHKYLKQLDDIDTHENGLAGKEITLADFQWQQLLEFIKELPIGCQTIFNLYAIEGYQHNEIAQKLGISEGTSKSQYSRARTLLQEKLNKETRFDDGSVQKK
ncbi:RNA polymerase sigma factor [Dyadobacter frigoris]|uniref:RNA polymerase sigma factor n=1 Tax=Dyadobacter frigoris TaxID=2576211 RepID=A0A4U6D209_9BACT|nr:RNA polymerase sigma factor [Dyadobacter frigoris]TKT91269.1 RNA polymerase sigma factor [Dyadobacter frigoris]GLU56273.1 DNA-directed RNA polymerase sigma-70 factor [Dyadobacter frigoris]